MPDLYHEHATRSCQFLNRLSNYALKVSPLPEPWRVSAPPAKARTAPESFARYLPAVPQDKTWGLQVTNAGYVKIESKMTHLPAGHPKDFVFSCQAGRTLQEYQLHYFPHGGGIFESKPSGRCQIQAGAFCLLFPRVWHRYSPLAETCWDDYWIGFKGPYINQLVRQSALSPTQPLLRSGIGHEALEQYRDIFTELQAESPEVMPVIAAQTMLLLAHVLAGRKDRDQGAERIISSAKCILRSNLDRDINLHALASSLNTSYTWLRRSFRLCTGRSLHQYHLHLRLQKAWQLLATSGCTVREAADQTGFNDEFYFSRLFKLKTGRSPKTLKPPRLARRIALKSDFLPF